MVFCLVCLLCRAPVRLQRRSEPFLDLDLPRSGRDHFVVHLPLHHAQARQQKIADLLLRAELRGLHRCTHLLVCVHGGELDSSGGRLPHPLCRYRHGLRFGLPTGKRSIPNYLPRDILRRLQCGRKTCLDLLSYHGLRTRTDPDAHSDRLLSHLHLHSNVPRQS